DRGALVALPEAMRTTYAATAWQQLPPGCRGLLVTLEYPQHEKAGPPFSVEEPHVHGLFDPDWRVALLERRDILASEASFRDAGVSAFSTAVYRMQRRH